MNALILTYKRLPKTDLYDSAVVKLPEEEVLLETSAQPIEEALQNLQKCLLQNSMSQAGFKKQRVEAELTDLSGDLLIASQDETQKFRADLNVLLGMFKPINIEYGRKE